LEQTYSSPKEGYKIAYPTGWTVQEHTASPITNRIAYGTAFVPPRGFGTGTTFLDGMLFVQTNQGHCVQFVNPISITLRGKEFMKGGNTNVGSSNYQRTTMYTTAKDKTCYGITLYVHGCNTNNACGKNRNRVNTFDPKQLNALFDRIVGSFQIL
jgi:hypothetical protein